MANNSVLLRKVKLMKEAIPMFKKIERGDKDIGFSEIGRKLGMSRQTISQWYKEWLVTLDWQAEELRVTTIHAEVTAYSRIEKTLPSTLEKLIDRIGELIPEETNLTKITMAFKELAPYYLHKVDDNGDSGDGKPAINTFYQNLFNQYNVTDGQSKESSNNGDKA